MRYFKTIIVVFFLFSITTGIFSQPVIIDHTCAYLEPIPAWAIKKASDSLHIAYGHTSHGSQITYGMKALANQSTDLKGYKGDYYCWKEYHEVYGDNPCLDIDDSFKPGDLGHNGDLTWAENTRDYLLHENQSKDINVVMWSWCGGCSDNTDEGIQTYLDAMNQLEQDFPDITFIYMTGHLDHWSDATLKHNNQLIRDYCLANNKVLYDFADIESYNPDGQYFEFANDNCDYYDADGNKLGNWAEEWQNSHVLGTDWYQCSAAHSKPLNGNRKAYAAWWLWARLIGWNPEINDIEITLQPQSDTICDNGIAVFSTDFNNADSMRWQYKNPDFAPFEDIYDNDIFANSTTKNLVVNVTDASLNNMEFRCKIYYNDTAIYTNPATLLIVNTIFASVNYEDAICNDTVFLHGNNPSPGICHWKVINGDAVIDNTSNNETYAYNLSYGKNVIFYITNNYSCLDTAIVEIYKYHDISISDQPTEIKATNGEDCTIKIKTSGDLEYAQWYKNDILLQEGYDYSGTNTTELLIKDFDNNDKGYYRCEIRGYCNTIFSDSIFVDISNNTDIAENITDIFVYPNPVYNRLNIKSSNIIIKNIEIIDINNRKIAGINAPAKSIDLSNLNTGLYFLKIHTADNIYYTKIFKL